MDPVNTHGATKLTMNSRERDYKSQLNAARQQNALDNAFVSGIQYASNQGPGQAAADRRSKYGDTPLKTNELMNPQGNFRQKDSPTNQPLNDMPNQTGSVDHQVSSTYNPEKDPSENAEQSVIEMGALERRLSMLREKGQAAGLNSREQVMRA